MFTMATSASALRLAAHVGRVNNIRMMVNPAPPPGFMWADSLEAESTAEVATSAPAPSVPAPAPATRKTVELNPLKAMILMKTWMASGKDQNMVKIVPDGKTGKKLKAVHTFTGDEATRRKLCKEQCEQFCEVMRTLAEGEAEAPQARVFSSLAVSGGGASTMSLVEALEEEWSVVHLCVSPIASDLERIAEAEEATLSDLRRLCEISGAAQLSVRSNVLASLVTASKETASEEVAEAAAEEADNRVEVAADAVASAVHATLRGRRTINEFAPELPGGWEAAMTRAVEAATFAPNHKRTEPWRFHLLGPQAARRVCELNSELVAAKKGAAAGEKKLARWLAMPGWLVVTCVRPGQLSLDEPAGVAREDYAACCCAVQNLCLSLHADGIGTKWTSGPVNFDARFGEAAGLPSNEYVVGTIWFGQAVGEPPAPPKKRLPIDEVLCRHD